MSAYQQGYQDALSEKPQQGSDIDYMYGYREGRNELRRKNQIESGSQVYCDEQGNEVKVSSGLSFGKYYISVWRKPGSLSLHRVKSKFLPPRPTVDMAQADLDAYARKKGWKVASEVSAASIVSIASTTSREVKI